MDIPKDKLVTKDERYFLDCIAMSLIVNSGLIPNVYDKAYEILNDRRAFFKKQGWDV